MICARATEVGEVVCRIVISAFDPPASCLARVRLAPWIG